MRSLRLSHKVLMRLLLLIVVFLTCGVAGRSQQLPDGVQRQSHIPEKTDDFHPFQILVGIQSSAALGQRAGDQDAPLIVKLNCPDCNTTELRHLSGRVL